MLLNMPCQLTIYIFFSLRQKPSWGLSKFDIFLNKQKKNTLKITKAKTFLIRSRHWWTLIPCELPLVKKESLIPISQASHCDAKLYKAVRLPLSSYSEESAEEIIHKGQFFSMREKND